MNPNVPQYTIAGLFESGKLGLDDEIALEEIRAIADGFRALVNPSRGWLTPRYGSSPQTAPRSLSHAPVWKRYKAWRTRWSGLLIAPSPSVPWGMTIAEAVVQLITSPLSFGDLARMTRRHPIHLVEMFLRAIADYASRPYGDPVDAYPKNRKVWRVKRHTGRRRAVKRPEKPVQADCVPVGCDTTAKTLESVSG